MHAVPYVKYNYKVSDYISNEATSGFCDVDIENDIIILPMKSKQGKLYNVITKFSLFIHTENNGWLNGVLNYYNESYNKFDAINNVSMCVYTKQEKKKQQEG